MPMVKMIDMSKGGGGWGRRWGSFITQVIFTEPSVWLLLPGKCKHKKCKTCASRLSPSQTKIAKFKLH